MDKSYYSGGADSTATSASSSCGNRDTHLKHLNKNSHNISKPNRRPTAVFENQNRQNPLQAQNQQATAAQTQPQPQPQPQVYNIDKNDFRDVVQKLTGSPSHERICTPPPLLPQPKLPSSRLQRIRPPALSHISNLPGSNGGGFIDGQRPAQSLIPPFPAAESPISAYMTFLQSDSDPKPFSTGLSPLVLLNSPRWSNFGPPPFPSPQPHPPPQQQNIPPPPATASASVFPSFPGFPSSPLPFGFLPSPKSLYGLLSPSPTFRIPSPMWKGI